MNLTDRQLKILTAIIEEYMKDASEVGSNTLVKEYDMNVSSATIRSEMAKLMEKGYLEKSHISSGRVPTDQAFRLYISELLSEASKRGLSPEELVKLRQNIFRKRFEPQSLTQAMLKEMSRISDAASFVLKESSVQYHGVSRLMNYEELRELSVMRRVLDLLEDEGFLSQLLSKYLADDVCLIIGEEAGVDDFENCSVAFSIMPFWDDEEVYFGIIGSRRLDYSKIFSAMRNVKEIVTESLKGWF
ncbi:hypothetical protein GF357_03500 [Candidatus Dojkabacteria bacterium]|nr:hypothetical protein [Candidatus Dojkabacteria bacterium]